MSMAKFGWICIRLGAHVLLVLVWGLVLFVMYRCIGFGMDSEGSPWMLSWRASRPRLRARLASS